ncbi:fungal-specific transcription factor domain-domain-containing protein [Clohesyomyces aquaticus]|uniref:Fungal-specific transcription factor domain-domain-containing protein n=1 Tax=Clohesyomyces aquaticus TaxID=1231657 RepID=A0A1Y1YEN1_9PLEO|nr:fungal-specific transcription factor domain-domain-containing protein [Clohesyomyces aquaticus]
MEDTRQQETVLECNLSQRQSTLRSPSQPIPGQQAESGHRSRLFSPYAASDSAPFHNSQILSARPSSSEVDSRFALLSPAQNQVEDEEECVIPLQKVSWEHHGPWSWVSICSLPGLRWVAEKTGNDEFPAVAHELTKTWGKRLKMKRFRTNTSRYPEPEEKDAWTYVTAYFENSYEAVFGIIHRPAFENRLRAFFDHSNPEEANDSSWFALRNIIYAMGCRCTLASDPSISFVDANARAHQFFQNAMSVFTDMVFGHTGLTAVQALALMALFAEGLGSAALEYPLYTNSVHLAQAKGLHRDPSLSWHLSESEILNRRWLWWAIYCIEKQMAFRSGRPSAIDDDNISTHISTKTPIGSSVDVHVFTLIVRHAQISAGISRRITSVKASKQSSVHAAETVNTPDLRMGSLGGQQSCPSAARRVQAVYLHLAIHGSLMATHVIFFYPWIARRFHCHSEALRHSQLTTSSSMVFNAARQIILTLRSLQVDASTPAWLAFYYPMYAHINVFIYLLGHPSAASASSDLTLLDISAGYYAQVALVTSSEISFTFPRESSAICARVIKARGCSSKEKDVDSVPVTPRTNSLSAGIDTDGSGAQWDADFGIVTAAENMSAYPHENVSPVLLG